MIRIALVEDEEQARHSLAQYLKRYAAEKGDELNITEYESGLDFVEQYRGETDVIFMDIVMPHLNGMDTARRLREIDENTCLVFITSMPQYALHGYEVGAAAYLVKPVTYGQLSVTLERIRRSLSRNTEASVLIEDKTGSRIVAISDILYLEVYNHLLLFHTSAANYTVYATLAAYEQDPRFQDFIKTSKSHLVNVRHIQSIGKDTLNVGGNVLPLTRRRRKECLERVADMLGEVIE